MALRGEYSGFGTDPSAIYSFRSPQGGGQLSGLTAPDRLTPLRGSLAYQQAGMERKQEMEKLVGMGLPAQTDINKVEMVGINPMGFGPIYRAPRPQPFGTFGSIGMNTNEEQPVSLPQAPAMPSGGPQPAQGMTPPPIVPDRSLGMTAESPMAFTGFGRNIGESPYSTPAIPQTIPSPIPRETTSSLTSFANVPRFPVREESFLNRTR
jgi:hypothetical protein